MQKAIIGLLAVIAFVFAGLTGCSRKEEKSTSNQNEKITITATAWPASAPIYIALEKGYFSDEGLQTTLNTVMSGHLGLEAVLSGKADIAASGESPIARAAIGGKQVAVVANICNIDEAILIIARKDRGISAPGDLRGKRIGVVSTTAAHFFLDTYLATSFIDPKEVQIIDIATEKLVGALLNGEVDAVSTWSPHTLVLRDKLGSEALVLHDPNIYTMTWVLVTTQDFANNHPETIKKLLRAIIRANGFISEQPSETRAVTSKYIGTNSPFVEKEWKDYHFTAVLDQSLVLNLEDQARWIVKKETDYTRSIPNVLDFTFAEALRAVQPDAVRISGK
jgi:ABC-type nitrate/sulfonate/bicarbonate transport system substrate-binding protein